MLFPLNPVTIFTRRMCAGVHFADTNIFIIIATILSTFNISKRTGDGDIAPNLPIGHAAYVLFVSSSLDQA